MKNMDNKSNPAQRLYEIMKSAKAFDGHVDAISGWAEVFNLSSKLFDKDDTLFARKYKEIKKRQEEIETMRYLSQLIILVDEVEAILKSKEDEDYESYKTPLSKIRLAVVPSRFSEMFSATLAQITESDIQLLRLCAKAIAKDFSEKVVEEKELVKIWLEIEKLYEEIFKAEINQELKTVLLELLEAMRQAIHDYRIRGIKSFEDAIAWIIGKIAMNRDLIKNTQSEELTRVNKIIKKFIAVYSFAADTVQLLGTGEIITKLLGK